MNLPHTHELARAFGYLREAEVDALGKLACMLPDNPVVVNIGAGTGTSGLAFMEARDDLILYTIEIHEETPTGGLQNERNAFAKAGFLGQKRHHQILGNSRTVGWEHGPVDMVFIDGDKAYNLDIAIWQPHIKPGGIIAFHDYGGPMWPDIAALVDKEMEGYEKFLHVETVAAFWV
jgi:predicted O-methyltransferase YrrM